jgi:hypothetical protein
MIENNPAPSCERIMETMIELTGLAKESGRAIATAIAIGPSRPPAVC